MTSEVSSHRNAKDYVLFVTTKDRAEWVVDRYSFKKDRSPEDEKRSTKMYAKIIALAAGDSWPKDDASIPKKYTSQKSRGDKVDVDAKDEPRGKKRHRKTKEGADGNITMAEKEAGECPAKKEPRLAPGFPFNFVPALLSHPPPRTVIDLDASPVTKVSTSLPPSRASPTANRTREDSQRILIPISQTVVAAAAPPSMQNDAKVFAYYFAFAKDMGISFSEGYEILKQCNRNVDTAVSRMLDSINEKEKKPNRGGTILECQICMECPGGEFMRCRECGYYWCAECHAGGRSSAHPTPITKCPKCRCGTSICHFSY